MQRSPTLWVLITVVLLVLLADSFWTSQQLSVLLGRQPSKYPQVDPMRLPHASVPMPGHTDPKSNAS